VLVEQRQRVARLAPEARRAQLVEIGVRLVSESSFDAVSVDDVAREAGISRGLLFHYFPTKRDFQVAVAEAAVEEFLAVIEPSADLPAEQQARAGLEAFIDYIATRREAFLSLVRGAGGGDPELRAVVDRAHDEVADGILAALREMLEVEETLLLRTLVYGYIAFIEETAVRWLTGGGSSRETLLAVLEQLSLQIVETAQQQELRVTQPVLVTEPDDIEAG
jgi:AcrR family transcriptional regulator